MKITKEQILAKIGDIKYKMASKGGRVKLIQKACFDLLEEKKLWNLQKIIVERYNQLLNNFPFGFKEFAKEFLTIKAKNGEVMPFVLNEWQERTFDFALNQYKKNRGIINILIIKGRQGGMTTFTTGFLIYQALALKCNIAFISNNFDNAGNIYNMALQMLSGVLNQGLEKLEGQHKSRNLRLANEQKTMITFYSSEGGNVRGKTIKGLLNDELGERTDDIDLEGLAVEKNTIHFQVGTPKGTGNNLHTLYTNAKNQNEIDRILFLPWFELKQYEDENFIQETKEMNEYLLKYGLNELSQPKKNWIMRKFLDNAVSSYNPVDKLNQEYPPNIEVGFNSTAEGCFCEPVAINKAFVKKSVVEDYRNIIIGVDIAGGGDTSAVCIRKGDYCELEILKHNPNYGGLQAKEKVQNLKAMILAMHRLSPQSKFYIHYDKTGSVGVNLVDYMEPLKRELQISGVNAVLTGVHFNESVRTFEMEGSEKRNARNSIYMNLAQWLLSERGYIVDKFNKLLEELLATKVGTINGEVRIIAKEKIKKALGRSPDFADALALCFFPLYPQMQIQINGVMPSDYPDIYKR